MSGGKKHKRNKKRILVAAKNTSKSNQSLICLDGPEHIDLENHLDLSSTMHLMADPVYRRAFEAQYEKQLSDDLEKSTENVVIHTYRWNLHDLAGLCYSN